MKRDDVPCRVSADLRIQQKKEDQYVPVEFDHTDEEHFRQVLPADLVKSVMGLVKTYMQLDMIQRSFANGQSFGINYEKAVYQLMPHLNGLREALARRWVDRDSL